MFASRFATCAFVAIVFVAAAAVRQRCPLSCTCADGDDGRAIVSCANGSLTTVPHVADPNGTRRVRLSYNRFPALTDGLFASLAGVRELELDHCGVRTLSGEPFRGHGALLRLDCSHNSISSVDGVSFRGLDRLHSVDLRRNRLTRVGAAPFGRLRSLVFVDLSANRIERVAGDAFGDSVATVNVADNRLTGLGAFANASGLADLYAARNPLVCDCRMQRFLERVRERDRAPTVAGVCERPPGHQGRSVTGFTRHESLDCYLATTGVEYRFDGDDYERVTVTCSAYDSFPHALHVEWNTVSAARSQRVSSRELERDADATTTATLSVDVKNLTDYDHVECVFVVGTTPPTKQSSRLSISAITKAAETIRARALSNGSVATSSEMPERTVVFDAPTERPDTVDVASTVATIGGAVAVVSLFGCAAACYVRRRRERSGAAAAAATTSGEDEVNSLYGFHVD